MKNERKLLTKEEIIEKILAEKKFLSEKFFISEIGLFGSYLRGEQNKKSDIDILIDYNPKNGISLFELVDLGDYLTKILGKKVDIALKTTLKPVIGSHILKEVIYI